MSRSATSDELWAEFTDAQRIEAVREGRATLKQLVQGLLDGSDDLGATCRSFLSRIDGSLQSLFTETETNSEHQEVSSVSVKDRTPRAATNGRSRKRRQGLPQGYEHRPYAARGRARS